MRDGLLLFRNSPREPGIDIYEAPGQLTPPIRIFDANNTLISTLPLVSTGGVSLAPTSSVQNVIQPASDTVIPLIVKAHSITDSIALLQIQTETGAPVSSTSRTGIVLNGTNPAAHPLLVTGAISQTAPIVEFDTNQAFPLLPNGKWFYNADGSTENFLLTTGAGASLESAYKIEPSLVVTNDATYTSRLIVA